jgi:hypothetical protein
MRTDREHKGTRRELRVGRIRVTPSLVLSVIALFAALASTGWAASIVPLAKHALTADSAKTAKRAKLADTAKVAANSFRVGGKTPEQISQTPGPGTTLDGLTAAQIAATPGPASSLPAGLFAYRTDSFELSQEGASARTTAKCQAGERAVAGGWAIEEGLASVTRDSPAPDGSGWNFTIFAESGNNLAAIGTVWAVCAKVS